MRLHDYQRAGLDRIDAELRASRRVLAVAPTGAGKGTMLAHLAAERAERGERVLVVAHRREIVLDLRDRIQALYARVGAVLPGERADDGARVQVASTQTLLSSETPPADLLLIDEAHHYLADEWGELVARVGPDLSRVGFTATPERADGRPLGDAFDRLVDVVSYAHLIELGLIVPCDVLRPPVPTGIDFAQDPVDAYFAHAPGTSAFMFTPDVAQANACVRKLRARGVPAAVIHANTTITRRERHVEDLRDGTLRVIVNAYTMTEGVDVPCVSTIVLARNTLFRGSYVQMTGRALRQYPGKRRALLLDLHGVSHVHGMPTDDWPHSLAGYERRAAGTPAADRATAERREPVVLGFELERVDWTSAPLPPPIPTATARVAGADDASAEGAPAMRRVRKARSPSAFWAALMRDVKRGALSQHEANAAFLSQHGRSTR